MFCKQKWWREKSCNARGRLPGDYGPLINQSKRAYYRSHIITFIKPRTAEEQHIYNCIPVEKQLLMALNYTEKSKLPMA